MKNLQYFFFPPVSRSVVEISDFSGPIMAAMAPKAPKEKNFTPFEKKNTHIIITNFRIF